MLLQREILRRRWELACRKYPLTTWGSDASPLPPRVPLLLCFQHSPTLCPLVLLSWWMSRPFICPSSLLDWFGIFRGQCTVWATVRIRSSWTGLIWIPLSGFHTLLLSFTRVLTEHVLLWASVCTESLLSVSADSLFAIACMSLLSEVLQLYISCKGIHSPFWTYSSSLHWHLILGHPKCPSFPETHFRVTFVSQAWLKYFWTPWGLKPGLLVLYQEPAFACWTPSSVTTHSESGPAWFWRGVSVHSLSCVRLFHDPVDCSPPGSFVYGIFQARTLGGLPFPSPGELPNPGTEPASPVLAGGAFTSESLGKPQFWRGVGSKW